MRGSYLCGDQPPTQWLTKPGGNISLQRCKTQRDASNKLGKELKACGKDGYCETLGILKLRQKKAADKSTLGGLGWSFAVSLAGVKILVVLR